MRAQDLGLESVKVELFKADHGRDPASMCDD